VLIFASTLILAIEAQYEGMQSGYQMKLGGMDQTPASERWPGAADAFSIFEWFFGLLFTAELFFKLLGLGYNYFKDPWNGLDFLIVAFWVIERVFKEFLPMDPKLVRMARLARLLRFVRVVKSIQAFDSLYLIAKAVRSSLAALTWSSLVLLLLEMMMALFLNVMLEDFWSDTTKPMEDRQLIFDYFGTFTRALQSMIEMLLGNWYTITRLLTSNVSEWYVLFGVSHQLVIGFAVIEVITGVFLHQTFKVANLDDGILLNETKREAKSQTEKMIRFFENADKDGNGELSPDEFREILEKDKVREWLSAMGLDVVHVEKVFQLFDINGDGNLTAEELIAGTLQLKGQAKAMELALLRARVEEIHGMLKPQKPSMSSVKELMGKSESSWLSHGDAYPSLPGQLDDDNHCY
jgi:Ca2+-binding EF-hand superfamily protein